MIFMSCTIFIYDPSDGKLSPSPSPSHHVPPHGGAASRRPSHQVVILLGVEVPVGRQRWMSQEPCILHEIPIYVYIYICVCMYVCMYGPQCISVYVYVYAYVHVYVCIYIYIYPSTVHDFEDAKNSKINLRNPMNPTRVGSKIHVFPKET